jgi:hypothetical protein
MMPQERPNHYGHLLPSSKPRWDECPGYDAETERNVSPRPRADSVGKSAALGLSYGTSPKFPTVAEANRRRKARTLRIVSICTVAFWVGVALSYVAFVVTH